MLLLPWKALDNKKQKPPTERTQQHLDARGTSRLLSNVPYRACYGLLWWLCGMVTGLTKSTDHPAAPLAPLLKTTSQLASSVFPNMRGKISTGTGIIIII